MSLKAHLGPVPFLKKSIRPSDARQVDLSSVGAPTRSNSSKLKYFTDHFFRKVFMLSIICNYFPLGVAVPVAIIIIIINNNNNNNNEPTQARNVGGPSGRAPTPGWRALAGRARPGTEARGSCTVAQGDRENRPHPAAGPPCAGTAPGPRARGAAAPRTHHRRSPGSGPTPSSNLAAARRRRRRASPAVPAALNNGRPGRALRPAPRALAPATAAAARRVRGARLRGRDPGAGDRGMRGRATTTPPGRGGAPEGPRARSGGAARARRSAPGNPAGGLGDWPGRSGPDLHVNGRGGPRGRRADSGGGEPGSPRPAVALAGPRGPHAAARAAPLRGARSRALPPSPPHSETERTREPRADCRSPRSLSGPARSATAPTTHEWSKVKSSQLGGGTKKLTLQGK